MERAQGQKSRLIVPNVIPRVGNPMTDIELELLHKDDELARLNGLRTMNWEKIDSLDGVDDKWSKEELKKE